MAGPHVGGGRQGATNNFYWIAHLRGAVPGVERERRRLGRDLAALDRDRPGLADDLAQRAVEPVLGVGAVGDVGGAADHVTDEGGQRLALRGGGVGVGDVVDRDVRIGDRRHAVELVAERHLLERQGLLSPREVIREVVGEGGLPGVRAVDRGAAAEQVVGDARHVALVVGHTRDPAHRS
jgi:hypothetical protein